MKEAKMKSSDTKIKEVTPIEELAILPLKNGVIYPNAIMPITIGQERSIKLVDDALVKEKIIGIVSVKMQTLKFLTRKTSTPWDVRPTS